MKSSEVAALILSAVCLARVPVQAQTSPAFLPLPDFTESHQRDGLSISREAVAGKPLSVIGPRGALLGEQNGQYEAWIFPWKIFSGMRISAEMQDYPVPISLNDHAASIDVTPDHTIVTYSHANFTVQQIMFAPKQALEGAGSMVLYKIDAIHPMTLTFSFDPEMQEMWPAPSGGTPSPEWVKTAGGSGFYILHEDLPGHEAAMAMPQAEPGILAPYQEHAKQWPLQFVLHYDPAKDKGKVFPLLFTLANSELSEAVLAKNLADLNDNYASAYEANAIYYRDFVANHASLESPDKSLNEAFSWAEVAIDQLRVLTMDRKDEALTAGFLESGDSARPGFGWFFGRDALWSLYAVNSDGDFETTHQEIEFLLRRQRADGKVMHEWSQTADLVDWKSLPYEYASADATELLPMAMDDYLKISGDSAFIQAHWDALEKAWQFETSHVSADGIYNNGQGTGWVESWIPSMPQQEIYLAALDVQASLAFAHLAQVSGHADLASQAAARAAKLRETIEKEYFLSSSKFYAFSHNADGTTDDTATIFPSVAWWDGDYRLEHPEAMLNRWASSEFSTDWGTRILSDKTSFYDPISYHQGTMWPLFTGWVSVAEYHAGRPLAGYAHLMQNANLTWAQDLGSATELLSGQYYQVLGRSTAHQLWSSAMVISPILRGMFGLEWNAAEHTLSVNPHLPADWENATLRHVPFGSGSVAVSFTRRGQQLVVSAKGSATAGLRLSSPVAGAKAEGATVSVPLPPVEVAIRFEPPHVGDETRQMKVLDEKATSHSLTLTLAAQGASQQTLLLRENAAGLKLHTSDATIRVVNQGVREVVVKFPAGQGYVTRTVAFSW